jgi:broad specificity phosphatase PhoE
LIRAVETAEILHGKPMPATNRLKGLRERTFGSLEGKPEHLIDKERLMWQELPPEQSWHYKFVNDMETDHELTERFIPVLEGIAEANRGKTILVAAHGGAIRTTIMKLKGLTLKELPPKSFQNAGYVVLDYDNGLKVVKISGVEV